MTLDALRRYCGSKPEAVETFPFGEETLVFKAKGRMFALVRLRLNPLRVNLKCDPGLARDLRASFDAVLPGYHMNKEHWNTVILDGSIPDAQVEGMIDHSYGLVAGRNLSE